MPLPGGPSSKFGNRYEQWWTVYQLVRIINGQADSIRFEDPTADKAEFVITVGSRQELHQAKRSHTKGKWSLYNLGSQELLLKAIFDQVSANSNIQFVFVSSSDATELRELAERARSANDLKEFESAFVHAEVQKDALKKLKGYWNNTDTATAYEILQHIEVRTIDERGIQENIQNLVSALFLANPDRVCDALLSIVEDSIHEDISHGHLISTLHSKGFALRQLSSPRKAFSLISQATDRYLEATRRKLIRKTLINRDETQELISNIKTNTTGGVDCVFTGKAGGGKTACVLESVETLRRGNNPITVLAFRLDRIEPVSSTKKLGEALNLEESPTFVLGTAAEATSSEAVLIIDQLDAVSTTSGRSSTFFDAIAELLAEAQGWRNRIKFHVVVVCRQFDWENDRRLRRLLIEEHSHITVNDFSLNEVKCTLHNYGFKVNLFAGKELELLRLPQNLSLFLDTNQEPHLRPSFSSSNELFGYYWKEKRQAVNTRASPGADHWNGVIQTLCDEMSISQQLSVLKEKLDEFPSDYLDQMASEEVLSYDGNRYGFGHETFFDYCFARAFVAKKETLPTFLLKSEQHLFRRAQVRQVLVYLRDTDRELYCTELHGLLQDENIRYHLKDLAVALAVSMPNPEENEWALLEPMLKTEVEAIKIGRSNHDKFASLVWGRFFGSPTWFHIADRKGLITSWIASDNDELVDKAVEYICIHQSHSGDRVAELLEPFMGVGGIWTQRFNRLMQWADLGKSRKFFELFLRLIDDGTMDEPVGTIATSRNFWSRLHGLETRLEWVPELAAHWLSRRLSIIRKSRNNVGNPEWENLLGYDDSDTDFIPDSANEFPHKFVQHVLPVVIKITDEAVYEHMQTPPKPDAVWPILFNSRHASIEGQFREALATALEKLAKVNSDSLGEILAELSSRDTYMANFFLLRTYTAGAEHLADDAVSKLCDKPWRLKCGYSDNSYRVSTQLIKETMPRCFDKNREKLEKAILDYSPEHERTAEGYNLKGAASFRLLSSIPANLRSKKAHNRYQELERKFGKKTNLASSHEEIEFQEVGSPIEKSAAEKMTDEQWLQAIKTYTSDTPAYREPPWRGGALEFARLLQKFVIEEPERFALLSLRLSPSTNPLYMEHTLFGLKESKGYTELKLTVCRKAYSEFRDYCGKEIADVLGSIKDELPDDAVQMLDWLATQHSDPDKEKLYGGNILSLGINTVRGHAAEAISTLIKRDFSYIERFSSTLEKLVNDKNIAVRACVGSTLWGISHHDWKYALEQFARLIEPQGSPDDDCLLTTSYIDQFMYYGLQNHFGKLRFVIVRMLYSNVPKTSEAGARLASLAALYGHAQAEELVQEALNGNPSQRLGVATVAAKNIGNEDCRTWSEQQLLRLFDDYDAKVCRAASECFLNLKEQPLEPYKNLINRFCDSAAYSEGSYSLLYTLEQSIYPLPDITYGACEKFLERFSDEAKDFTKHQAAGSHSVMKLVLRTYHQHQQVEWTSKCLDLIDRMCLEGIYDIRRNLDEYER